MPKVKVLGKEIYYEIHGKGEPLVILNGIMMSTASWTAFVDVLSKRNKLILMDFVDQGQSDKADKGYTQDFQVDILKGLLDNLQIYKIHLLGISYGGEVAQRFALRYEEKLLSLILANTTCYTNKILHDVGDGWISAAKSYDAKAFFRVIMPYVYSPEFYEKNFSWLKKREEIFQNAFKPEWYEGFIRLTRSAEDLDLRDEVHRIKVDTLIIGAEYDTTTPLRYQVDLNQRIEGSKFIEIKGSGHATMYEKPEEFVTALLGFIEASSSKIKIL